MPNTALHFGVYRNWALFWYPKRGPAFLVFFCQRLASLGPETKKVLGTARAKTNHVLMEFAHLRAAVFHFGVAPLLIQKGTCFQGRKVHKALPPKFIQKPRGCR